ncbi:MAG: hypothetical protein E4G94_03240 [ANME-2 cluster archaeon]|nr:MAG: hypothetical protein E4G94_03240 [ANME-2 cluster archaeon]
MNFHEIVGFFWLILLILLLIFPYIRLRSSKTDRIITDLMSRFNFRISDKTKYWLMICLGVAAIVVFLYCELCGDKTAEFSSPGRSGPLTLNSISHIFYKFAVMTFPFIIWGILIAGFMMKYFFLGKLRFPKNPASSFVLGATLPLCSCGVVPMVKAMIASGYIPVRTIINFLVVTPILNPFVIFLSYTVLGWEYLALRIAATFILALGIGILMEKLFERKEFNTDLLNCGTTAGCTPAACSTCSQPSFPAIKSEKPDFSAVLYSYELGKYLLPYMIIGVLIGAFLEIFVPPQVIGEYFSSNILGLLIATTVGIPIFICSGEEILILKPLMDMGLPLGHAIAFTIAGNGICVTSIALLLGILKTKATVYLTAMFWIGTFLISLLINILVR